LVIGSIELLRVANVRRSKRLALKAMQQPIDEEEEEEAGPSAGRKGSGEVPDLGQLELRE
jgi:hypothetical protein